MVNLGQLAARFHVSKYPTLKMFRFGSLVKREYRGQRSASALTSFVRKQLVVPLTRLNTPDDIYNIDVRHCIQLSFFHLVFISVHVHTDIPGVM